MWSVCIINPPELRLQVIIYIKKISQVTHHLYLHKRSSYEAETKICQGFTWGRGASGNRKLKWKSEAENRNGKAENW